jgi:hypothetical protein
MKGNLLGLPGGNNRFEFYDFTTGTKCVLVDGPDGPVKEIRDIRTASQILALLDENEKVTA